MVNTKEPQDVVEEEQYQIPAEEASRLLLESLEQTRQEMEVMYEKITEAENPGDYAREVEAKRDSCKRTAANLRKACLHCSDVSSELSGRWKDLKKGRRRYFFTTPANAQIDLQEKKTNHFARGINGYKLMLLCFIGCFAGVVMEMAWCYVNKGYTESRAGLVYGPFNMLYGAGAVVMTLALYRLRNRGAWLCFLGGMLVGSLVEYACSWGQEMVFGSVSWDYSNRALNLNGRICLQYSIYWGVVGLVWMKMLYPWTAKLILKLPNRLGKVLTWAIGIFLVFNCVMTCLAVFRWSQRIDMIEPANAFWQCIDRWFPNDRMEEIFVHMKFR